MRGKVSAEEYALGPWLSRALEDPNACEEMKEDIRAWFDWVNHRAPTQIKPPPHGEQVKTHVDWEHESIEQVYD